MTRVARPFRRGLTLLELMMALAITAMVAMAITGMLTSIAMGHTMRRDNRAFVIRSHALMSRLAAYVSPSACVLDTDGTNLVLWFKDARESGTVHASEIRWIIFDIPNGRLDVHYVAFPDMWTDVAKALEDTEYPLGTDWFGVLAQYDTNDFIDTLTIMDGLDTVAVTTDEPAALDSREIIYELGFTTKGESMPQRVTATIFHHDPPSS